MTTKSNGRHLGRKLQKIQKILKQDKQKVFKAARVISHAASDAKVKFNDVEESMEKYAKANPWKTMGFSVLAGVVVAKLLHLRK